MLFSLIENLEKLDVILASGSPRRFEILKNAGLDFRVELSGVTEDHNLDLTPEDLVMAHARSKGQAVAQKHPKALVISADTIVVHDGMVLGKPEDEEDAYRMLRRLSGETHEVMTAFGLFLQEYDQMHLERITTAVSFRPLRDEEILEYIGTGEPFDKAGAYAIQGQGAIFIKKINGSYLNVVGFPLTCFYLALEKFMHKFVL